MPTGNAKQLLGAPELSTILHRLCCQLIENHGDFSNTALIGLQPRGTVFARRVVKMLHEEYGCGRLKTGLLDITFFRDDFRRREAPLKANQTKIDFIVEDLDVVFLDDVLYTGRSIRAAMDAVLSFGRPRSIELMVLIDRRYARQLPIQPDYTGRRVDSIDSERVVVEWMEEHHNDGVFLTRTAEHG